jgi:hypothetical protein
MSTQKKSWQRCGKPTLHSRILLAPEGAACQAGAGAARIALASGSARRRYEAAAARAGGLCPCPEPHAYSQGTRHAAAPFETALGAAGRCRGHVQKNLKDDLGLRPIYHRLGERIEAHIFIAFMAYCLHVSLRPASAPLAPGLTQRAVLDKPAAIQMLDVQFPTTDGRTFILSRYTELNADQKLLVNQLKLACHRNPRQGSPPPVTLPAPQCNGDLLVRSPILCGVAIKAPELRKSWRHFAGASGTSTQRPRSVDPRRCSPICRAIPIASPSSRFSGRFD